MQSTGYLIKEAALQFMGQRTNVNYLKCINITKKCMIHIKQFIL